MSLSPFPARGGIPPPVPPKVPALPHIAALATASTPTVLQKHKKNAPSLSKAISFDNFVNFYSNSRNPSPTKQLENSTSPVESPQTKTALSTAVMGPKETSSSGLQNSLSQPSSGFSLASAKQRAKGVFTARRKGSQSDLETMKTVQEVGMDSPTIPGRPAAYQETETATGWRNNAFSEILVSSISSPPALDNLPVFSPADTTIERPILPLALPPPPHTPWSAADVGAPPQVPPKTSPVLQKASTFLERRVESLAIAEGRLGGERVAQRPRADSAPPVRHTSTRVKPHVERHNRKKSNISPSLPLGVKPSKAPIHYPYSQIESLQTAAKLRSEEFCVLNPKDVEGLSKELSQLETRCQYLRETHKSLRDGRRTLHTRMLTYLRTARSAVFSRESLLKQEEALAELDAAIDDWHNKLEKAEDRRARVREKLLEHIAAALSVPDCAYSPSERGVNTPPTTPERQGRSRFADSESITIYALLADVEQEIKRSTTMRY
ncbi:Up-regulated during septation-domain-containing protein [Tuber brumale]|nr:Up-regulated during septation-domain-containing protein [Tuber brumale]